MKAKLFFTILFAATCALAAPAFEEPIRQEWEEFEECFCPAASAFLPEDVYNFLESTPLEPGQRLCLAFYPRQGPFTLLIDDSPGLIDYTEFLATCEELDLRITHLEPRGQFAYFDTREEAEAFFEERFGATLDDDIDLSHPFPIRVAFAIMEKQ